jgi:hypothetical protein
LGENVLEPLSREDSMLPNELSPLSDEIKAKPWGFWATLGFSAIIFGLFSALQFLIG